MNTRNAITRGFTTIELLVVIAIIAIMGLILVAVLGFGASDESTTKRILQTAAIAVTEFEAQVGSPPSEDRYVEEILGNEEAARMLRNLLTIKTVMPDLSQSSVLVMPVGATAGRIVDAWAHDIVFRQSNNHDTGGDPSLPDHARPFFASRGRDGEFNTDDDLFSFEIE